MAIAGSLTYETKIDKSGFEKGLKSLKNTSSTASSIIKKTLGAITTAIIGIGTYSIKVGSDFETGMSKVKSISGATGDEINKLTDKAKEMGQKTKFSATESAEAFQYMAMAGWKTEDMLNGIEGIMNLAAASGEDLASVSDIVTDALTAFGLQAKDSAHFADVLAKASSNSNTNVGLMGETFKYVAPLAGSMKYSVEDTAVAIGLMANAGIKGSQAGTALRSMLTRLVKPPKEAAGALNKLNISAKNSDGTMKPLSQTMQELRIKFANLSESEKASYAASIAGQEAMSGMLAIVNASKEDFNKLTASISKSDGASKGMADTMNDNVKGAFTLLRSNIESVGINIYDKIKEPLKNLINTISKYVSKIPTLLKNVCNWVIKNKDAIKSVIKVVASLVAGCLAYKAVLLAIKAINIAKSILGGVSAFISLIPAIKSSKDAMILFNMVCSANPIGLVVAAVAALAAGLAFLITKQTEAQKEAKSMAEEAKNSSESLKEFNKSIDDTSNAELAHIENAKKLKDELTTLVDENGKVKKGYEGRVDFILNELNEALGTEYTRTGDVIDKYKELQAEIDKTIEKKKAEIKLKAEEDKYKNAIEKQGEAVEKLREIEQQMGMTYNEAREKFIKYKEALENKDAKAFLELGINPTNFIDKHKEMEALGNYVVAYKKTCDDVKTYTGDIKQYEADYALFVEGKYDEMCKTITVTTEDWTSKTKDEIKTSIGEQKNSLDIYKRIYEETGNEVAKQNVEQAQKNLEDLRNTLVSKTSTIGELGQDEIEAWKALGENSFENYNIAIAQMGPEMQVKIQEATGIIAQLTPEMAAKAEELGTATVNEFDKSSDAKQKALNTIMGYFQGLNDDQKRQLLQQVGIEDVDIVLEELNKGNLSEEYGKNILTGLWNGLKNGELQSNILGVAAGLAQAVNKAFTGKDGWDEHSPSKKMKKFAEYYIQPISDVMNKRKKKITNTATDLVSSINKSIIDEMNKAVSIETGSINAKAILQANKEQPIVIARDQTINIDNKQVFEGRNQTPYEQQREAKQQLRRLAYGL